MKALEVSVDQQKLTKVSKVYGTRLLFMFLISLCASPPSQLIRARWFPPPLWLDFVLHQRRARVSVAGDPNSSSAEEAVVSSLSAIFSTPDTASRKRPRQPTPRTTPTREALSKRELFPAQQQANVQPKPPGLPHEVHETGSSDVLVRQFDDHEDVDESAVADAEYEALFPLLQVHVELTENW